ncbi:hypothetical protein PoB_007357700 [Plakobranchus ocellatus]|uniref:Uncharacterized protein n=1 Tax=Plakobranchus ocellatus TaxID=259542 RepID=A0AAV4DRX4_9GAST|nr:hypothetical protein PoB_007357700 [Plakobranchus ocellatus]
MGQGERKRWTRREGEEDDKKKEKEVDDEVKGTLPNMGELLCSTRRVIGDGTMTLGLTVACESALRSAGTLLSRVRAPLPAPWPDGGPESLRSPCCGLAIYKKLNLRPKPENQLTASKGNLLSENK